MDLSKLYKIKQKGENLKSGLDTGGGYGIIGTQRKGPSFEPVLGLYLFTPLRRKNSNETQEDCFSDARWRYGCQHAGWLLWQQHR